MYKYERISSADYPKIKSLSRDAFDLERSLHEIKSKYNTDLFGVRDVGMFALTDENFPAAYYGVFPLRMRIEGKNVLVAQSGDTMTSRYHRKKGLFIELAKKTYSLAGELGIHLVFGFPNEHSYSGFKNKLNWVFNGHMQKFKINSGALPWCELASKNKISSTIYLKWIQSRIKQYAVDYKREDLSLFLDSSKDEIIKDVAFFDYKLSQNTTFLIKVKGFLLFLKFDGHLKIGAVSFFEEDKTVDFVKVVKYLGRKFASKSVVLVVSDNHWLFDRLKDRESYTQSLPIGFYLTDPEIKTENICFTQGDYDTF